MEVMHLGPRLKANPVLISLEVAGIGGQLGRGLC